MADIKYEVKESFGILSKSAKGWTKELRSISWNSREPKYDIREWAADDEMMGKGITLSKEDLKKLKEILLNMDLE